MKARQLREQATTAKDLRKAFSKKINMAASRVSKVLEDTSRWLTIIVASGVAALIFLVVLDVGGRYIFGKPFGGVLEISEMLMVFVVYGGVAYCHSRGGNITVDLLVNRFSTRLRALATCLVSLLSLAFFVLVLPIIANTTYTSIVTGEVVFGVMPLPIWPSRLILTMGILLLSLHLIVDFVCSTASFFGRQRKLEGDQ